jgi:dTDP-4-dehydrorhamnose 3,5-epimerase-like enzyme
MEILEQRGTSVVIFTETELRGAYVIAHEGREETRAFLARTFRRPEFEAHGRKPVIAQTNVGYNRHGGTIRGTHFQYPPTPELKLVRATRGRSAWCPSISGPRASFGGVWTSVATRGVNGRQ